jgi:hypothetical protein
MEMRLLAKMRVAEAWQRWGDGRTPAYARRATYLLAPRMRLKAAGVAEQPFLNSLCLCYFSRDQCEGCL